VKEGRKKKLGRTKEMKAYRKKEWLKEGKKKGKN